MMSQTITGSSETIRKTTFNFSNYRSRLVSHKRAGNIKTTFLEWFVGFSEGDGSFTVSGTRLFFIINQKEEGILHRIRTELGFGKVSHYKTYSRFIVADRDNIERLIHLFNGNLVLNKTVRRFSLWVEAWNLCCSQPPRQQGTGSLDSSMRTFCSAKCIKEGFSSMRTFCSAKCIKERISSIRTFCSAKCIREKTSRRTFCRAKCIKETTKNPGSLPDAFDVLDTFCIPFSQEKRLKGHAKGSAKCTQRGVDLLPKNQLPSLGDNAWLCGFVDAEGWFAATQIQDPRYTLGWRLRLRFLLDEKSERELLERVRLFLASGTVYGRKEVDDMWRFSCTSIAGHQAVVAYFVRYPLRTRKRVSFLRFASLLRYIINRPSLPWKGKVLMRVENLIKSINKTGPEKVQPFPA